MINDSLSGISFCISRRFLEKNLKDSYAEVYSEDEYTSKMKLFMKTANGFQ